ncbi:hypothetical protein GCM10009775_10170 [Microbacterium aoyamense]|uniref:ATP-grasp domain-containing protein n=1 Tax=Microbacterium aoyamense TaxID=344166 RepID=A0ABN2PHY8_9MICO
MVYDRAWVDPPLQSIVAASKGLCDILWVLPFDRRDSRTALRLLRASEEADWDVIDASRMSLDDVVRQIVARNVSGITCLADSTIVWTAEVAGALHLPFHSREVAARLTDKLEQRTALAASGMPTPAFWNADDLADEALFTEGTRAISFPVVVKPRRGSSSRDTERVESSKELETTLKRCEPGRMLVEGFIPDPTTPCMQVGNAPYVSVELLVSDGVTSVLGVTGKPPLAAPFRETGDYFPAETTPHNRLEFTSAAIDAVSALGIRAGVLHVEIKCTDDGPVVIEVNGRPGGGRIRDFIERAHGIDPIRLAFRIALGEQIVYQAFPEMNEVLFLFSVQPDARLRAITAIDGFDDLLQIEGVEVVERGGVSVGDAYSWRDGTMSSVAEVSGVAPDHETARRIRAEVLATIRIEGTT